MSKFLYILLSLIIIIFISCTTRRATTTSENIDSASHDLVTRISFKFDTIHEEGVELTLLENLRLFLDTFIIYKDTQSIYEEKKVKVIPYSDSIIYILLKAFDPTTLRTLNVLRCTDKGKVSTKVIEGKMIKDIDNDGVIEIIGQEYMETVSLDSDSFTYSPIKVHKLGICCLRDKKLTKELTTLKYGCYLGDECVDTLLISKTIIYNGIIIW